MTYNELLKDLLLTQLCMLEKRFYEIREASEEIAVESIRALTEIRKYRKEVEDRLKE